MDARVRFSRSRVFLASLALAGAANAAEDFPPLHGTLGGELRITALEGLNLGWRIEVGADGLILRADRPGVDIAATLRPLAEGAWSWRIERGELDVAELWPAARAALGVQAAGWSASGRIELGGEGAWSSEAGPSGELRMALREGWARSDELEAELSGLELDLRCQDLVGQALAPKQTLRVAKVAAGGAELNELLVEFGLRADQVLEVARVEANFLGGRVRVRPFALPLAAPAVTAAAEVDSLRLEEVARLMPWLLQTAQGRLRGRVELSWDGLKGLRLRDGGLDIVRADDAAFRLAPSPGLLTGEMPERFSLLPWRWARWIGLNNPVHGPLKDLEMGREGLRIENFEVDFWPDGPGQGRTAAIRIVGRPTDGRLVEEVKLDVNFHGRWSEFLAFGLNQELSGMTFRFE